MDQKLFKEQLKKDTEAIGIFLNEETLEKFYQYKECVLEWNEKINLTAIKDDFEFIVKHFVDSLTIDAFLDSDAHVIDIGTGAGFPGIPIKILHPEQSVVLFDSLNKRIKVLEDIVQKLNLTKVELIHGRAEEAFKKVYREKFDIAVSRAVANLNVLVELMLPAVKVGGKCICMKGNNAEDEIEASKKAIHILGGKIEKIHKVLLPELDLERNIIIIQKVASTPSMYPRKPGTPQKEPIH